MHLVRFELLSGLTSREDKRYCWINSELISTIEDISCKGLPAVRIIMENGREMEVNVPKADDVVSKIWSTK